MVGFAKNDDPEALAAQQDSLNFAVGHLAAHKICAYPEQLPVGDIGLIEALLDRAADHRADLVVIGAFGGDDSLPSRPATDTRDMLRAPDDAGAFFALNAKSPARAGLLPSVQERRRLTGRRGCGGGR